MNQLTVTEKLTNENNLLYLSTSLGELFASVGKGVKITRSNDRVKLIINCESEYLDVLRFEMADKIAEVIAIKYKYEYIIKNMPVCGLSEREKEILYVSLIAADLEEDKKYVFYKIRQYDNLSIDGVFNFNLKSLKNKWADVCNCMPNCFLNSQLKDFITFLLENKKKRVYVDDGMVFDNHFRRLKRCSLIGKEDLMVTKEVLLSNCGEVELTGHISKDDERYLREFYADKIIFSD